MGKESHRGMFTTRPALGRLVPSGKISKHSIQHTITIIRYQEHVKAYMLCVFDL
jgi:hypothetical protein